MSQLRKFLSFRLHTQNSQGLEKSACSRHPKTDEARRGRKELPTDISALCFLQDPWKIYLRQRRTNYWSIASK